MGSAHTSQPAADFDRLAVTGRVLTEDGAPLVEARISVRQDESVLGNAFSMASGRYELELDVAPCGPLELACEAPGHLDARVTGVIIPGRYDFTLRRASKSACGLVLGDRFEDPVAGAIVRVTDEAGELVGEHITDVHGRFCFHRLGEGIFRCTAAAPGFSPAFAGFPVIGGEEVAELVLRLGWTDRFVNLLVIESGTARSLEGARVTGTFGEVYRTDAAGVCALPVPPQAAVVTVTAEGHCGETVVLRSDDPAPVVELEREHSFAVLLLASSDLLPVEATMTQAPRNGPPERRRTCRIDPLPDGRLLAVWTGLDAGQPVTLTLRGPRIRTAQCDAALWSDLYRLEDLPVCKLEPGQALRGIVRDGLTGAPVPRAHVGLFDQGQFELRSRTMSPPRFVLTTSPCK